MDSESVTASVSEIVGSENMDLIKIGNLASGLVFVQVNDKIFKRKSFSCQRYERLDRFFYENWDEINPSLLVEDPTFE